MADDKYMFLLNCTDCDDILRLDEDRARACLCGKSTARRARRTEAKRDEHGWELVGPSRLLRIEFEQYDSAAPGEPKKWEIVPT